MAENHKWSVELRGERFDLEDLPRWTSGGKVRVISRGGSWFLVSPMLEELQDAGEVRLRAEELLSLVNGMGRVVQSNFRPVSLGNVHRRDSDGRGAIIALVGAAEGRSKALVTLVIRGAAQLDPQIGLMNGGIDAALESEETQRLLLFLGQPDLTWNDLYRAYEVLKPLGIDHLLKRSGVKKDEKKRFSHTANSFSALGLAARHGVKDEDPPPVPMTFREARSLIIRLAKAWLDERLEGGAEGSAPGNF